MDLNPFRLDVDEAMSSMQVDRAAELERQRVIYRWQRIQKDLENGGPMSELLTEFRREATQALSSLVYADPNDARSIAALQADVQRSLRTMEHIDAFQNAAKAADANEDGDLFLTEEDLPQFRQDEE